MKMKCIFIAAEYLATMAHVFSVGESYPARKVDNSLLGAVEVESVGRMGDGLVWSAIPAGGNEYALKTASGDLARFVPVKASGLKLAKKEKRIALKSRRSGKPDMRRKRRTLRQYSKLRFTDPAMYCFIADRRMKKMARNG